MIHFPKDIYRNKWCACIIWDKTRQDETKRNLYLTRVYWHISLQPVNKPKKISILNLWLNSWSSIHAMVKLQNNLNKTTGLKAKVQPFECNTRTLNSGSALALCYKGLSKPPLIHWLLISLRSIIPPGRLFPQTAALPWELSHRHEILH